LKTRKQNGKKEKGENATLAIFPRLGPTLVPLISRVAQHHSTVVAHTLYHSGPACQARDFYRVSACAFMDYSLTLSRGPDTTAKATLVPSYSSPGHQPMGPHCQHFLPRSAEINSMVVRFMATNSVTIVSVRIHPIPALILGCDPGHPRDIYVWVPLGTYEWEPGDRERDRARAPRE
jgi:hypothetical protein